MLAKSTITTTGDARDQDEQHQGGARQPEGDAGDEGVARDRAHEGAVVVGEAPLVQVRQQLEGKSLHVLRAVGQRVCLPAVAHHPNATTLDDAAQRRVLGEVRERRMS